ncbi:hypothetical protein Tco_1149517, partial [Tanacetum coccineum]
SCGNGAHYGFNCPPKASIISNPEQCNQTIDELPHILPRVHLTCNSGDENSFTYDSNSVDDSPNIFNLPPQPLRYSCEFCGNDARYGHYYCGGPHETFQCQPTNEDYYEQNSCYDSNSFGFDQYQPLQFPVNFPPQETNKEILQAQEDLMKAIQAFLKEYDHIPPNEKCMALLLAEERFLKIKQTMEEEQNQPGVIQDLLLKLMDDLQILKRSQQEKKETAAQSFTPYWDVSMINDEEARDNFLKDVYTFLRKFSRIPFGVTPKVILIAWESFGKIKDALMDKQYQQEDIQELMSKLLEDVRNISEEFSEYINCPSWNRPLFYFDDDDDEYTVIWRRPKAITPDEPSEEPEDPLIMGEEELSTIPEKDKSSVEDLVPIPSGSKGFSDDICDNDHFDAESLLSQDIPITSPKIDFLSEEFAGELAPIPPGMDEDEFDEEEDDCYDDDTSSDDDSFENIDYVEASPPDSELVSLEEVEDVILRDKLSNVYLLISKIEADHRKRRESGLVPLLMLILSSEYDYFFFEFEPDQEYYDSEGDIHFLEELLDNDSFPLPEFESFHFDPSFPRPLPEPPDVEISLIFEPSEPVINNIDELNEDECFDPGGIKIDVEDDDSFTFVIWTFLPYLTYTEVSPLLSSTKNEDTIFDPGIST